MLPSCSTHPQFSTGRRWRHCVALTVILAQRPRTNIINYCNESASTTNKLRVSSTILIHITQLAFLISFTVVRVTSAFYHFLTSFSFPPNLLSAAQLLFWAPNCFWNQYQTFNASIKKCVTSHLTKSGGTSSTIKKCDIVRKIQLLGQPATHQ